MGLETRRCSGSEFWDNQLQLPVQFPLRWQACWQCLWGGSQRGAQLGLTRRQKRLRGIWKIQGSKVLVSPLSIPAQITSPHISGSHTFPTTVFYLWCSIAPNVRWLVLQRHVAWSSPQLPFDSSWGASSNTEWRPPECLPCSQLKVYSLQILLSPGIPPRAKKRGHVNS